MTPRRRGPAWEGTDLLPPPRTWLNRLRRERDVNQATLAQAIGVSERTLQRIENGEVSNPPVRHLVNCAWALRLDNWLDVLEDDWVRPGPYTRGAQSPRRVVAAPPPD